MTGRQARSARRCERARLLSSIISRPKTIRSTVFAAQLAGVFNYVAAAD